MTKRLEGKVALITGAGTGVGRACMMRFAQEGAKTLGAGRTSATLEAVVAEVKAGKGEARMAVGDLSRAADVERVVEEAKDAYGRIDILVHAAGVGYSWAEKSPGSMNGTIDLSPEKWREVIEINLDSYYLLAHAVLPGMVAQKSGSIIAVSSISGMLGLGTAHAYCAAKAGMINLTRSLCVAHAKDGIRANCVAPGFIDTPMVASVLDVFDDPAKAEAISPMRRPGSPMEIANGCLYFASDESSYCNGSILIIDGGTSARQ
jgi:NAD(P)-dependent dehydrogenase (short-subunit alcohol dehydrogenase family)